MFGRRPALPCFVFLLAAAACRPAPQHALPSLVPSGPLLPTPTQTLPALGAAGSRDQAPPPGIAPPLAIAGYGPRGPTQGGATIFIRFNQPVVSLEQTGKDLTDVGIALDPKIAGRSYFQTPELLVFEPVTALPIAHRITAQLVGPVVALTGARLTTPLQWELETPRPRVTGWDVRDLEDEAAPRTAAVVITVDQPTTREALQPLLTATARAARPGQPGRAQPIAVQVTQPTEAELKRLDIYYYGPTDHDRIFLVHPVGLWPGQSQIELTVQKGLHSTAGPLPSQLSYTSKFRTLSPLRLVSSDCAPSAACGLQPIAIRFNNRISQQQADKLRIVPKPADFAVTLLDSWSDAGRELTLSGIFMPGTTYRVQLPADLTDKFGQRLGQAVTVVAAVARRPTLALNKPSGILRAGEPQTVGVLTRHVQTLQVRGAVLDDATAVAFLTQGELPASADQPAQPRPWPTTPLLQFEHTYPLSPRGPSDWDEVVLDLAALSGHAQRTVLVEVQASQLVAAAAGQPLPPPVRGLYRLTDLGPVAVTSQPQQILAVMRLSSGLPVAGTQLSLHQLGQAVIPLGRTDSTGILVVKGAPALAPSTPSQPAAMLVAESAQRDDRAYLPWPNRHDNLPVTPLAAESELRPGERVINHLVTERDAYLPSELVRGVGWSAIDTPYQRSGLRRPRPGTPVQLELEDSRGRVVATHQTTLTTEGKFWAELAIPEHGALGPHRVHAHLLGNHVHVAVKVEDFRVPEFSVAATVDRADVLPGESTQAHATATYFFGGPARIHRATYNQRCEPTGYTPPGLTDGWYVGAALSPEWHNEYSSGQSLPAGGLGHLRFAVQPPSQEAEFARRCTVHLTLTDLSFQTIGAQTQYLAHAARYYLAVQQPGRTLTAGDRARIPVRAVAVDGTRLAAPGVRLAVVWHHFDPIYKLVDGQQIYERTEEHRDPVRTCTLDLGKSGPDLACEFPVDQPGTYELVVRGRDQTGTRYARTETMLWVQPRPTDPNPALLAATRRHPLDFQITYPRQRLEPGDTLQLILRAPWLTASGVVVLARNGLREHRPFQLHDGIAQLAIPIDDTWFPQVSLEAFLVHSEPHARPRLERASHTVELKQDHRRLQVTVTAPGEAGPGAALPITVRVQDAAQKPCPARVALWAVDEAVLSLTDYNVKSPLAAFVPTAYANLAFGDDYHSFIHPFTGGGNDPWFESDHFGSSRGSLGGRRTSTPSMMSASPMVVQPARNRFETTPLFLGDVATGPDGIAHTTAHLPDNLTTFRITAVASARLVDGESPGRFGQSDARVRVSTPFIVRAALPRLLRPDDAAEIGALVNNLSGPRGRMQLTVRIIEKGPPSLQLTSPATIERTIQPGDQLRLPFTLVARHASQTPALVEIKATLTPDSAGAPVLRDAVQLPLPVLAEPTLRERVAIYGDLTSAAAIALPLQIPDGARGDSGGLTISASTSLLGGVAEAAADLIAYPYGCIEQTASRLLPLVALRDVMQTHPLPVPDGDVKGYLATGVQRMLSMQTAAGGFAYWPGGREPNVYASAYATWVLQLASRSGYPVPSAELGRAADYLQRLVEPPAPPPQPTDGADGNDSAADPSPLLGDDLLDSGRRALAVQALAELGRPVPRALAALIGRREELPLFARALLVLAVHAQKVPATDPRLSAAALGDELLSNLAELPSTAHVNLKQAISLEPLFDSATRTDAMVLLALLRTHPQHPVVAKLARGLLERRGGGGWRNTQETAYAVLALAEYAHIFERDTPELTTRAWLPSLSPQPQWQANFSGQKFATQTVQLPMAQLLPGLLPAAGGDSRPRPGPSSGLILQRTGQGRLYYRVGLQWSPAAADLPARAQGLRVERLLRSAHGEVTAQTLLTPAEPVSVELLIENRSLLNYVVVDVPLPAGLEAVQQHLGYGQLAATLPGPHSALCSHEEVRRDRALLFFDLLPPGLHRHTVHVRATTPGRYILPPAQAEAMYAPEIYGRSPSSRITVTADLPQPH